MAELVAPKTGKAAPAQEPVAAPEDDRALAQTQEQVGGPAPAPEDRNIPIPPREDVPSGTAGTPLEPTRNYSQHREQQENATILQQLRESVEKPARTEPKQETAPAELPGVDPKSVRVAPLYSGGYGAYIDGMLVAGGKTEQDAREAVSRMTQERTIVDEALAVAGDVAEGVALEGPTQAVGGASDAIAEMTIAADELADWMNTIVNTEIEFDIPFVPNDRMIDLNPTTLIRSILPEIDEADTVTGGVIRSMAQFITGYATAGKALKGAGLATGAASTAGKVGQVMVRGAIADATAFDPMEDNLANVLRDVAGMEDPVTEFMSASEDDSRAIGRIKKALEGAGLGLAADGFVAGLRGLRAARQLRSTKGAQGYMAEQREQFGAITDRDFIALGDPSSVEIVSRRPTAQGKIREAEAGKEAVAPEQVADAAGTEGELFINWSRIDTPDDVKSAMRAMADMSAEELEQARRGVRTNLDTEAAARQLDAWEVLQSRREGAPLNAEESVALRNLWAAASDKLTGTATAAATNPSEANMFAFRKMLAIQDAIQKEVIAARTETARALQSWRIPAGGEVERARQIQDMLTKSADEPEVHRDLARRLATLGKAGEYDKLNEVARRSALARTHDAVMQAWINGLLMGPKTHMVNMMSNTSVVGLMMTERATAARLALLLGDEGSVQVGEAMGQMYGAIEGFKDALRLSRQNEKMGAFWEALRTGESQLGINKVDIRERGALSAETWNVASETGLGRTLDALDFASQLSFRALAAEDEIFKSIGYRMELHALARRQAITEAGGEAIDPQVFKERVADLVANPPEELRLKSLDAALYQTFNSAPGKMTRSMMKLRNDVPVLGPLLIPFARTVGNLTKFSFERTPVAPLMGHVRADIAAGGARRDLALTRIALGSSLMSMTYDMVLSGQITGPPPKDKNVAAAQRRAGIKPYSVKVGDRWVAYDRLDPVGSVMAMAAGIAEITANSDQADESVLRDTEAAMVATAAAIGANFMNKSYLTGISDFTEMLADPDRYAERWSQGVAASFVPYSALSGEARRMQDPYMREVTSMWEAIANRVPGLSEDLPARRDLWGRPLDYRSGLGAAYDALSPIYVREQNPEPIDKELMRLGNGPSMPPHRTSFEGVTIDLDLFPGSYSRFLELAGNGTKLPKYGNLGALDALNEIVSGKSPFSTVYELRADGIDGGKIDFIRSVVAEYRDAAKRELLADFPEIVVEIENKKRINRKWSFE